MKITENTKGLTGSITNIDTEELNELVKQNKALRDELEDARERLGKVDDLLEKIAQIAFKMVGNVWEEDSVKIERICKEALKK